ncbi:hypothetical protein CRENBAI_021910 [Crenichthys baileyi]|uniref:Uncharacterized protein n=1 Tax=Crenichthys baileyi TaxID=28760 RepID=A0AAV9QW42_9TELE
MSLSYFVKITVYGRGVQSRPSRAGVLHVLDVSLPYQAFVNSNHMNQGIAAQQKPGNQTSMEIRCAKAGKHLKNAGHRLWTPLVYGYSTWFYKVLTPTKYFFPSISQLCATLCWYFTSNQQ